MSFYTTVSLAGVKPQLNKLPAVDEVLGKLEGFYQGLEDRLLPGHTEVFCITPWVENY